MLYFTDSVDSYKPVICHINRLKHNSGIICFHVESSILYTNFIPMCLIIQCDRGSNMTTTGSGRNEILFNLRQLNIT